MKTLRMIIFVVLASFASFASFALLFSILQWVGMSKPAYRILAREEPDCTRYRIEKRLFLGVYAETGDYPEFSIEEARKRIQEKLARDEHDRLINTAKWKVVE